MALKNLTSIATKKEFDALPDLGWQFGPPRQVPTGDPAASDMDVTLVKWVALDIMGFTINRTTHNGTIEAEISPDGSIVAAALETSSNGNHMTYWTVEMGAGNAKPDTWHLTAEAKKNGKKKGNWTFTKSKSDDD